jgi:1-acyl-sn-glycerol-3-phosphate acyltransferase
MILFRNLLFYLVVIVFTFIFSSVFVIVLFFIRILTSQRTAQKTLRFLIVCYGRIIIYGFCRILVRVSFIKNSATEPPTDPCVYIVNHRSASDAFLIGVLSGEFVQIVNLWPFKIPILGVCARLAGYLSVRSMPFDDFSNECKYLFSQKVSIVGFPEGTRSMSSKMGQFHSALFRVAQKNQLQIVPLCILGNQDKPRRKSLLINPGKIEIHQLPPISHDEYKNFDSFELKNHVRNIMQIFIDQNENKLK